MKKVLSTKKITMFLILLIIIIGTRVFATDSILGTSSTDNNTAIQITQDDMNSAQTVPQDSNYANNTAGSNIVATGSNTTNNTTNNTSNGINTSSQYNTVDEDKKDLPQTGIEDHNIGILLIICVAAAIYAYKKMRDYKNV